MVTEQVQQHTLLHNLGLAEIFHKMSECYRYLGDEERFRAQAYEKASQTLFNLKQPVDVYADDIRTLDELPGVGESIGAKIIEFLHSGRIAAFQELKSRVPFDLLELMEIDGIGPATLRAIHEKSGIRDREQLTKAIAEDRSERIWGLSGRKLEHLRRVLKLHKPEIGRMPLSQAWKVGHGILQQLFGIKGLSQVTLAGSLRREKETVGDIDILGVADPLFRRRVINHFVHMPNCQDVLARGDTKASIILKEPRIQVDLRLVSPDEFGAALLYLTGSKEHNIQLRRLANTKGWKMNEYGVFSANGKRLAGKTEEGIYRLFGFPYIPPQQRLGKDELGSVA